MPVILSFAVALHAQTAPSASTHPDASSATAPLPSWAIGPFTRQADPEPVIKQNPEATFVDPIKQKAEH
jgi:hypothetical protein